jgi:CRP-like cAMP-binding protein
MVFSSRVQAAGRYIWRRKMSEVLYSSGQSAACAYLLRSGEIEYKITDEDSVRLSGNGIIVGASEILLSMNRNEPVKRHASLLKVHPHTQLNPIPTANFASFITTYAVGFSVAHHIAETITKIHPLLTNKMSSLSETERYTRDLAHAYVEALRLLENESGEKNFPWLVTLIDNGKGTEIYNFGLSISDPVEEKKIDAASLKLSQYRQFYPKGKEICREGEKADAMFIVIRGKIEVRVKNIPVDIISHKSAIIGEMGLILGQPRTATLRALDDCDLIRINAGDMESIFKSDPDTFFSMISSLAIREQINCDKIREYSRKAGQASPDNVEYTFFRLDAYAHEYAALVTRIQEVTQAHPKMDWLSHVNELLQHRAVSLLSQAGTFTGELYRIQAIQEEKKASPLQQAPAGESDSPLTIDWF